MGAAAAGREGGLRKLRHQRNLTPQQLLNEAHAMRAVKAPGATAIKRTARKLQALKRRSRTRREAHALTPPPPPPSPSFQA